MIETSQQQFIDSVFGIRDLADPSKLGQFDASAISAATARVLAFPNASGTIALQEWTDDNFQPLDAGLTSLADLSYSAASFVKMTEADTFALRTIGETADDLEGTIVHDNLASVHQGVTTGASPTFADLTLSSPSNIYALSHDSFADFVATEHIDHAFNLDADLALWYRMDDISGSTVSDNSANSNDGTLQATAAQTTGIIGKGVVLDGDSDYIEVDDGAHATLDVGASTDWSVSMKIKTSAATGVLISHYKAAATTMRWRLFIVANSLRLNLNDDNPDTDINIDGTTVINDGKWHTVTFTCDRDGIARIYIDGGAAEDTADISGGIVGDLSDLDTLQIGAYLGGTFFTGVIDDVRIYVGTVLRETESINMHELGCIASMTALDAAYFEEYVASKSGFFNNLVAFGGELTTGFLTVTGGFDIDINASDLIGVGDILPDTDGSKSLGSAAKTWGDVYLSDIIIDDTGSIRTAGPLLSLTFDDTNGFGFLQGKVGIGTLTPATALDVFAGNILVSNTYSFGARLADTTPVNLFSISAANDLSMGSSSVNNVALTAGTNMVLGVGGQALALVILTASGNVGLQTATASIPLSVRDKSGNTTIGGFVVRLTNKTGANTVAGQLVIASTGTDDAFATAGVSSDAVIGIVLDAGIADGSEAWVVVSGVADVLMDAGGSAHGDRIISSATAGSADVWNVGGAVATHFLEIGHCIETRVGAGLARCILHFN